MVHKFRLVFSHKGIKVSITIHGTEYRCQELAEQEIDERLANGYVMTSDKDFKAKLLASAIAIRLVNAYALNKEALSSISVEVSTDGRKFYICEQNSSFGS